MANATITASATGTAQESNDALVTFTLSSALTSSTTVKATLTPQGGTVAGDYSGFQYHMGTGVGGWLTVPVDGMITLNAGFTSFQLKTSILYDTITEGYDSLAFTVAQTASSVGLENSWWVPSLVSLTDAVGTGTTALTRSISAGTTTNGVEGGAMAAATFAMSGSGSTYASTEVRVTMNGLGGATLADYNGGLQYNIGAGWANVVGDLITVPATVASFQLGIAIATDSLTESTEGISFSAAQTAASVGLVNSWWVPSTVNILDAQGTGAVALPRTITANAPTATAVEGSTAPATATFTVSGGGTADYANTQVRVSMYGLGGATAVDYGGVFSYKLQGVDQGSVPATGLITIPSSTTTLDLYIAIATDTLTEASEGISFNLAQTTSSLGLVDSWWVPSTVNLQDARGTGAMAFSRTITTSSPTTVGMEGSTVPATATFAVSYDPTDVVVETADYASSQVRVSMYGLGGAAPVDYTGDFQYRIGTSGTWVTVPGNGLITIPNTATAFQLSMLVATDTVSETGEAISFNVAQTTSSLGLVDSWWVPKTVDLADVTSVYTTVTGSVGPDHFTATANPDMFVIPHGTSKAMADGATGLIAGDIAAFISGESFDTITGFTAGTDKIDLPITVTSLSAVTIPGTPLNEEALIAALSVPAFTFALASGVVGTYSVSPGGPPANVYFFADTSGDGWWTPGLDTFVKIIGGVSVTTADFV